jgi:hypothetical protein
MAKLMPILLDNKGTTRETGATIRRPETAKERLNYRKELIHD